METEFQGTLEVASDEPQSPDLVSLSARAISRIESISYENRSTTGTGTLFGITEFANLSDPPKKYRNLTSNAVAFRRATPGGGLPMFSLAGRNFINYDDAGAKTQQFAYDELRGSNGANWSQIAGLGSQAVPSNTPWQVANDGSNAAGSAVIDSLELYNSATVFTPWSAYWWEWQKQKRSKFITPDGILGFAPSEDPDSPGFLFGFTLIGSTTNPNARTAIYCKCFPQGGLWRIVGFWSMQQPAIGSGPATQLSVLLAVGDQEVGDDFTVGQSLGTLTAPAGSGVVSRWFDFSVPPDSSLRLRMAIAGEADTFLPRERPTTQVMLEAGLRPWIYLGAITDDPPDEIYSENLGNEDTLLEGLARGGASLNGSSPIAQTLTFTGGITAESHDPIDFEATVIEPVFSLTNLEANSTYRLEITVQDSPVGSDSFGADALVIENFQTAENIATSVSPTIVAPVGFKRRISQVTLIRTGTVVPPPILPPVGFPVIATAALPDSAEVEAYSFTVTGFNSITTWGASGLPTGLSINTGSGAITGSAEAGTQGDYQVTISATNANGTTEKVLPLTIGPEQPPPASAFNAADLAAAYGLRPLVSGYAGNLFRLRRASDNAEQTFAVGYTKSQVAAFLGASNGFLMILYDQSGNGINLSRTGTTQQLQWAASGPNSAPCLLNDGGLQGYAESAAALTARACVAALRVDSGGSSNAAVICNRNDENLEIRIAGYGGNSWDTYNFGNSAIQVNGVTTTTFTFGQFQVLRMLRAADGTFTNPFVVYQSRVGLGRYLRGRMMDLLFYNAAGAAQSATDAATLKTLWGT